MLRYEFETVGVAVNGYSFFSGVGLATDTHRETICRRAAEGWRFVGCIPTKQRREGFIEEWDLIFEREE